MRNKLNKGFTLIELLVVVAIIGILAAVGVVAYNGYTKAAKINATKSIHANVLKYFASEMAKCDIDSGSEIFSTTDVTCGSSSADLAGFLGGTAAVVADAASGTDAADATSGSLQDRNPYHGGAAIVTSIPSDAVNNFGYVLVDGATTEGEVSFTTEIGDDDGTTLTNKVDVASGT